MRSATAGTAEGPVAKGPPEAERGFTLIVAAMDEELAPLRRRCRIAERLRVGGCRVERGFLGETPVLLARTGEGRERAARGAEELLERFPVRRMLVVGIAGGLTPALHHGSLVLARRVQDDEGTAPAPDAAWLRDAERLQGVKVGTVVTADRILVTASAKAEASARLPEQEAGAVDLESAAYATVAAGRGVPYLVLRAISDVAEEDLPLDLNRCRDGSGAISRTRVLWQAVRSPGTLPGLWQLKGRTLRCARRLAGAVEELLAGDTW
jgi:adenosylhomocysteine nucleosidase